MSEAVRKRFSNVQLLLLELFSEDLSEEELLEIKQLLSEWRFKRATEAANRVVKEKGWTKEDFVLRMLRKRLESCFRYQYSFGFHFRWFTLLLGLEAFGRRRLYPLFYNGDSK